MSETTRIELLCDIMTALGLLMAPVRDFFHGGEPIGTLPHVRARYAKDSDMFLSTKIAPFVHIGGGVVYNVELRHIEFYLNHIGNIMGGGFVLPLASPMDVATVPPTNRELFDQTFENLRKAILAVPCDIPDFVADGNSPFVAYCSLKRIIRRTKTRLDLFDPYLDAEVFHRYLADLDLSINILIVTSDIVMLKDKQRRDRIVSVSELYAAERPTSYSLRSSSTLHDRHLRIDDDIYQLGGSLKDAAKKTPYTIAKLDPTPGNHAMLDGIGSSAAIWFGPMQAHRKT